MSTPPPFSSFEVFLFEALTLRSNAVYRQDVDKLMEYEDERAQCDWVTHYDLGDRPYQAAQSIIATWELICRVASHPSYKRQRDQFLEAMLPLGPMYLWLAPAIDRIDDEHRLGEKYAESFRTLGQEAIKTLPAQPEKDKLLEELAAPASRRRNEAFVTAWNRYRPLTHFG